MTVSAGRAAQATGEDVRLGEGRDLVTYSVLPLVFTWVLALSTFALVFVGGLVTSAGAGLAVPDWPLSYGHINPPGWWGPRNVRFEHGHRLIGWFTGAWVILTAVVLQVKDQRARMRRIGWWALVAVIAQGLLGGIRVVAMETYMAAIHGCTGQAFFCLVVAMVLFTTRGWVEASPAVPDEDAGRVRRLALLATIAVYIQVVLGSIVRHSGAGHQFEHVLPHLLWGLLAAVLALRAALAAWGVAGRVRTLRWPALLLGGGVLVQIMMGLAAYLVNMAAFEELDRPMSQYLTTAVHQTLGAVVLASGLVLWLRSRRLLVPAPAGEASA